MSARENICFINNYNNGRFISECLDSVIAQTHPFDRIIVVDDGSTDCSLELLFTYQERYPNLEVLKKNNGGQLSTFNFIVDFIPSNSQVFLLDGDDAYPLDYLELVLSEFKNCLWDFAFCERSIFHTITEEVLKTAKITSDPSVTFKLTSALTLSRYCWIGHVTSTLSISGEFFKKIFPFDLDGGWTLAADDHIIYSASILGAQKTHLASIRICWRHHDNNHSLKGHSIQHSLQKTEDIEKMFSYYCQKANIDRYPTLSQFYSEFRALPERAKEYLKLPNHWKIANRLVRHRYLGGKGKNSV